MTTWAEAWDNLTKADTGADICDCGLLPIFGIIIPVVLVIGAVGLILAAIKFKREGPPPSP